MLLDTLGLTQIGGRVSEKQYVWLEKGGSFLPERAEEHTACRTPALGRGPGAVCWGGGLTASSVCLCLGSANYLCALAFLRSSSRCFICATGGVIREKEMWCWCANTPLGGWVEKLQSLSQEQLAEEQSQHKMPKAKRLWPNVFDFISAEGLFPLPAAENRQGLRPGAEDCAASYGEFLSTCESFTWDFCSGGWGLITYSV